jgi:uncharacterized protein YcbK (DUF882 family)
MKLTEHFDLSEFESNDGATTPLNAIENLKVLAKSLEELRKFLDCTIYVNSGYRSPEWNRHIGGVHNSMHIYGKAADLRTNEFTPKQLYKVIDELIMTGWMDEGGLGLYDTFVHYDNRGERVRWDRTTK